MDTESETPVMKASSPKSSIPSTFIGIGVVAAILLGLGLWHQSRTRLACNSPELFAAFQKRFEEGKQRRERDIIAANPDKPNAVDEIRRMKLVIRSTTTLGQDGNLLVCSMDYNYEHAYDNAVPRTFNFTLGRDDQGSLVWPFNGYAPYQYLD